MSDLADYCQNPAPHGPHSYLPASWTDVVADRLRCDGTPHPGTAAEMALAARDALVWQSAIDQVRNALANLGQSEWTTEAQDNFLDDDVFPAIKRIPNPFTPKVGP